MDCIDRLLQQAMPPISAEGSFRGTKCCSLTRESAMSPADRKALEKALHVLSREKEDDYKEVASRLTRLLGKRA